ncbi:HNH endonuclease signature motif containing protein [Zavarzinia aquatilis]|nr:HNH endonuclease signature motif containing protein [Zavarzinia aquatilis]
MPPTFGARPPRSDADRKRDHDQRRESAASRGYGRKWQAARLGFLASHPLCRECGEIGRVTPATEVDHIQPHRGDQGLFWDRTNWQPLCKSHHSAKTAREGRRP